MEIFVGADHGGYELRKDIIAYLSRMKYEVTDVSNQALDPDDDYPQFGYAVAMKVLGSTDPDPRGIVICTGGQGVAIAANRVMGVRAVVVTDEHDAKHSRLDNDANVLSLSAHRFEKDPQAAYDIIDTWLSTEFSGAPRHQRRIKELDEL